MPISISETIMQLLGLGPNKTLEQEILSDTLSGAYGAQRPSTTIHQIMGLKHPEVKKEAMSVYGPALKAQAGTQVSPPQPEVEKGSVTIDLYKNKKKIQIRLPKDPVSFNSIMDQLYKQGFTSAEKEKDTYLWDAYSSTPKRVTPDQALTLTGEEPHRYQTMEYMLKEVPISAEEQGRIRTKNVRRVDLPKWLAAGWVPGTTTRKDIPVEVKEATKWVLSLAKSQAERITLAAILERKAYGGVEKAVKIPEHLRKIHDHAMGVLKKYYGIKEKEKPKATGKKGVWNPDKKVIEWQ